jgi:ATP-dependent Clp protease, protease subunit
MEQKLEFKHIESIDKETSKATIRLDGRFGTEIDGAMIAHEISYLDRVEKVKEIHLHINTVGGVVFDSLSVVSAILSANAEIHGHNDGLCMSAGFHTWLACDVLHAFDYAIFMYHEASYSGMKRADLSKSEKQSLDTTNASMATLIANRLNKTSEEVALMLKDESYFQATEFEEKMGMKIDIKTSARKPNIKASMSLEEVTAEFESFTNTNLKTEDMSENKDMTEIMAKLEISADEKNPMEAIMAKFTTMTKSVEAANSKVKELTASLKTYEAEKAESYIDSLIADEKIKPEAKESMLAAYIASPDVVKATFSAFVEAKVTDIIEDDADGRATIEANADGEKLVIEMTKEGVAMDYRWYSENDSDELKLMMRENPDKYNFLLDQYNK